jgi:hypothetical protein
MVSDNVTLWSCFIGSAWGRAVEPFGMDLDGLVGEFLFGRRGSVAKPILHK